MIGNSTWIPQEDPVEEWPILDSDIGQTNLDEQVPEANHGRIGSGFFERSNDDWKETFIGKTTDGKDVKVLKCMEGVGYEILVGHKNSKQPSELQGRYTSYFIAEREARLYIAKQRDNAKIASN